MITRFTLKKKDSFNEIRRKLKLFLCGLLAVWPCRRVADDNFNMQERLILIGLRIVQISYFCFVLLIIAFLSHKERMNKN